MWPSVSAFVALSLSALVTGTNISAQDPTARVTNGTYIGRHSPQYAQDFFLGIPYAQPPVGHLRFRQAQSLNNTWTGFKQAIDYSPLCVGYGLDQTFYNQSEDCLTLNVVRPAGYSNRTLPVGLWIHGGGYVNGGGGDQRYNLSFIVDQSVKIGKPFIGVSINYRLHGWGFLNSNEFVGQGLSNIGLRDQRLALHWVQENIAAFGGDAGKVTIFGESAGAASVGFHLVAYGGRNDNLFRAAILQSGNPIYYIPQSGPEKNQPIFNQLVSAVGCNATLNQVECLRQVPFAQLNSTLGDLYLQYGNTHPVIDGDLVRNFGSLQLQRGEFVRVPIIVGANSDEGTSFSPRGINTTNEFKASLANLPPSFQESLIEAYPDDLSVNVVASLGDQRPGPPYGPQFRRSASYWGDYLFIAARRKTAATWAAHGLPAYSYRFNAIPHGVPPELGSNHFKEIHYVFRNYLGVGNRPDILPFEGLPESHFELAAFISSSWSSFINDLDPNSWQNRSTSIEAWPEYRLDSPKNLVFDANITSYAEEDTFRKEGIDLINDNALGVYHR